MEHSQPLLPLGLSYVEGVTHGYIRHGTTTLFAALDVATGRVLAQCRPRHRHQEFLGFLKHIDANVLPDLDIHLVLDNYGTYKHARVKRWLLADRPRYHLHFTPTYASWLNQVEIWFHLITQKAIRRGSFASVTSSRRRAAATLTTPTPAPDPSRRPRPPTPSSTRSRDYAWLFPGHNTRRSHWELGWSSTGREPQGPAGRWPGGRLLRSDPGAHIELVLGYVGADIGLAQVLDLL